MLSRIPRVGAALVKQPRVCVPVRFGSSSAPSWFRDGMFKDEYDAAEAAVAAAIAADSAAVAALAKEEAAKKATEIAVLSAAKANLEALSKNVAASALKGPFIPTAHEGSVHKPSSSEALVVETHPRQGGIRTARAFYATPWNSTGLDGGDPKSLLARYKADIAELDTKIAKLKA